ncbi:ABC transporter ATP-binding protein [Pseudomonas knackmussii]|uniref:ABC transporter ATP-binding protein n=1 Tax=Pseudomonas knackmussii TaxID=65741 RepID=UPI003F4A010F
MSTLEIHAVSRYFGASAALEAFSLSVPAGSRTAVVGPSGSGKTTLLRLIAGFEFPDTGRITFDGVTLADETSAIPAHRRVIGYVPQDGALFPHLSVAANIAFGLDGHAAEKQRRVDQLLEMVSLDRDMGRRWPHELSGGQQQRVALARALAQSPRLMLLDEPFSALDSGLRVSMRKAVSQVLSDAGVTAILVTHDQEEALSFGDQLAVLRQGRLVQAGAPKDLYLRPADEETAFFLGDALVLPASVEAGWARCPLGRVRVGEGESAGRARILLRPEQLHLSPAGLPANSADGCFGTVVGSDFGGNKCTVTVRLDDAGEADWGGGEWRLPVRVSALDSPDLGSRVHLFASGQSHLFRP